MKKILAILVLVLFGTMSFAQWQGTTPGNLYMTQGNVGIGQTNPAGDIQVLDATGTAALILESTWAGGAGVSNLGQLDIRVNGGLDFYRNLIVKNAAGQYEMRQSIKSTAAGGTLNFMNVNFTTRKFLCQAGINDAEYANAGVFYINNGTATGAFDPLVSGKVGIGTTSILAGVKLQVGGKIKCQEVEVAVTPWPDHVFKTGFNLMPLDEVESFININKHLPNVPSEESVAANGVKIGEMNATLLQKIEELTLYMISLKKENDALKARVSNLEK